ncbi:DUF4382 domain-containing protein [Thalassotalea maritima]|uniref:DUF4382 domain-containing protein n=1 Tax=Thalassotalea maritima TaxID=3242416 RepID=UPI003528827C
MKRILQKSLIALSVLAVVGCGGSDDDKAKFSLGISDAPVDNAEAVVIELDAIRLTKSNTDGSSDEILVDVFTDENGDTVETVQVNLLDFQGSSQIKIVDEAQNIELDNGTYDMELTVVDSGSYVLFHDDATEHPIKVPSSRLRLGEFPVSNEAVQINDEPAYTIEFDLRQSLVQRGNANNNNGYIIKPHGVRVVSLAGHIEGNVDSNYTNLGQCSVYLYGKEVTEYGDMFDSADSNFAQPDGDITASAPLATAVVDETGMYSIGFVQAGSYQLALMCGTQVDDNVQFDGLTIPSAADITPDVAVVEVVSQQTANINFD